MTAPEKAGDRGRLVYLLTHPQVAVDPAIPVPRWGLSAVGLARAQALRGRDFLARATSVWSSTETKAAQAADALAGGIPRLAREDLGENDRSATGFVPPQEFEQLADAFFAEPDRSVRGWARARDEQARMVAAIDGVLADPRTGEGDVVIVAHGAVGTLLLCHLLAEPISRTRDQPGQGHWFSFDRDSRAVHGTWRALEDLA